MKHVQIILLIFIASFFAVTGLHAQQDETPPMQQCQTFSDCTLVWGGCSDVAINKLYARQFKPVSACSVTKAHDPKALPTCENNACVVVVQSKKNNESN